MMTRPTHKTGENGATPLFSARRLAISTQNEPIAFLHADCPIARSEGLTARAQIELGANGRTTIARLYLVDFDWIGEHEVGLSEPIWHRLDVNDGDIVTIRHPQPLSSMSAVRAKLHGQRLGHESLDTILQDVTERRYSDVQIAAFLCAFAAQQADVAETVALTRAMVEVGERMHWPQEQVLDKHCVGGLPGNRTTPIIVAIVAAAGLTIPKTSSRAITSPAGTADVMETMACVDLDAAAMARVVEQEGGCLVWGGSVRLSPADDILIRVERALELDTSAQLVASVLSKKVAAGSKHVLIDIPTGETAKLRTTAQADALAQLMREVGKAFHLQIEPVQTDGSQPVGRGVGPALEARDVLRVLRAEPDAPIDLANRSTMLAGRLLELGGACPTGKGSAMASGILHSGRALEKFLAICRAQGGFHEPGRAALRLPVAAPRDGTVQTIDNRCLARLAKLAGAPRASAAGLSLGVRLGDAVSQGDVLFTLHGETPGELDYAMAYYRHHSDMIKLDR